VEGFIFVLCGKIHAELCGCSIASTFNRILLISVGVSLFASGNLLDAYTFDVLGKKFQRRYGTIRLWAAVAWGTTVSCLDLLWRRQW
jgi:hypothetical protein